MDLKLNNNQITSISKVLLTLPKLMFLDLSNNLITDVISLGSLTWLIEIDLRGNDIYDFYILNQTLKEDNVNVLL